MCWCVQLIHSKFCGAVFNHRVNHTQLMKCLWPLLQPDGHMKLWLEQSGANCSKEDIHDATGPTKMRVLAFRVDDRSQCTFAGIGTFVPSQLHQCH